MRHANVAFLMVECKIYKEELNMSFTEICIYQVKPQRVDEFETLMLEAKSFLEEQNSKESCYRQ